VKAAANAVAVVAAAAVAGVVAADAATDSQTTDSSSLAIDDARQPPLAGVVVGPGIGRPPRRWAMEVPRNQQQRVAESVFCVDNRR
jgi:hypothetical protein